MKYNAIITLIYGLLILVGGFIGHSVAGSTQSLISGIVCGTLLIICSVSMFMNKVTGYFGAISLAFILSAFFMTRLVITSNFLPSGLLAIISFIFIVALFAIGSKNKTTDVKSKR